MRPLVDAGVGAGVAQDADVEGGGAQVDGDQEVFGEVDLVVRYAGVAEAQDEGAHGLRHGSLAQLRVLLTLQPRSMKCLRASDHFALDPPDVADDEVLAPLPAQVLGGFEGGGEVTGKPREVSESAARIGCETAAAGDDLLHAAARVLGAPEVSPGFGQTVDGHVLQRRGQQAGFGDRGEARGGAGVATVLLSLRSPS